MAQCLIGLGSNLGDRAAQLDHASELLYGHPQIQCMGRSTYYATRPVGGPLGQDSFLNAAMRITTQLSPRELLAAVRAVEQQLGRARRERWGPRKIDIDILLYDQEVLATAELIVPHPRMAVRRFVLEPANEVAADMLHPGIGWTVAELLRRLTTPPYYAAIAGIDSRQTTDLAQAVAQVSGAHLLLDPTAPAKWPSEDVSQIELVQHEERVIAGRCSQLGGLWAAAQKTAAQAAPPDWYVSNYWLPQSMAMARAGLQGAARLHVEQVCEVAVRQVPLPHCVVFLDTDADADMSRHHSRGMARRATHPETATRLETRSFPTTRAGLLMQELADQASQRGQGPVVHVPGGDPQLALTELTAAIDAMR